MLGQLGKYTLLQKLGDGGMAEVFLAQISGPAGFTKMVALKRMLPHLSKDPAFTRSFINEARLGGYLNHHNIVQTVEFGELDDFYYLAMEYVRGVTLEDVLLAQRACKEPIPTQLALEITGQIADGLAYAHTAEDPDGKPLRMVHRDLKPSNILINTHGGCKISDFGVARSEANSAQTVFGGELKGTVSYMSPEQAMGERDLDARSDLFSLGAIFFELLANEPLYPQGNYLGALRAAQDADFGSRLEPLKELPHGEMLHVILSRALARERGERYPDAQTFARELNHAKMQFEPDWELAQYLKALLPKSPLNMRQTVLGVAVGQNSGSFSIPGTPSGPQPNLRPAVTSQPQPLAAAALNSQPLHSQPSRSQSLQSQSLQSQPGSARAPQASGSNPGYGMAGGSLQGLEAQPMSLLHSPGASTPLVQEPSAGGHGRPAATTGQLAAAESLWKEGGVSAEISQTMTPRRPAQRPTPAAATRPSPLLLGAGALVLVLVAVAAFMFSGPATARIESQPPGALLATQSGQPLGTTPLEVKIPREGLPVVATLEGFTPLNTTLKAGESRVILPLVKAKAVLALSVVPTSAQVELDGSPLEGSSPYRLEALAAGPHAIAARLKGYEPLVRTIELKAGETLNMTLELKAIPKATPEPVVTGSAPRPTAPPPGHSPGPKPKPSNEPPGFVTLNATPYALVEIDGQVIKNTPLLNHPLPPGPHKARLRTEDGRERVLMLNVVSGETVKQIVRFD